MTFIHKFSYLGYNYTQIVAYEGCISPIVCTAKMNYRLNSSCTCPYKIRRILQCEGHGEGGRVKGVGQDLWVT